MVDVTENKLAEKMELREMICDFEEQLSDMPMAVHGDSDIMPLEHIFTPGIYTRQITIKAGTVVVGKIHRHEHPSFLMSGRVRVVTEEGGMEEIIAPKVMVSPSGTKRAVFALEDAVWVTVHSNPTDTQDLDEIEKEVIAKTFKEIEESL
jgi:hypothetical protein